MNDYERERERAVFVELHGGVPHSVMTERGYYSEHRREWSTQRTLHDVDNVAEPGQAPDLYHHDSGGGGSVQLGRFCRRWRRGYRPADVWWRDDVEVLAARPLVDFVIYTVPRRLGACRLKRWLEAKRWDLPERVKYGRAGRLALWRLGYRRLKHPPASVPPDDPFGNMVEGDTVWCQICKRRYGAECEDCESYLPGYREDRGRWFEVTDRHLVDEAAGALAASLLENELLELARERFSEALRAAARQLSDRLEDAAGTETREHVCEHVWWENGGGWTGPGSDE